MKTEKEPVVPEGVVVLVVEAEKAGYWVRACGPRYDLNEWRKVVRRESGNVVTLRNWM